MLCLFLIISFLNSRYTTQISLPEGLLSTSTNPCQTYCSKQTVFSQPQTFASQVQTLVPQPKTLPSHPQTFVPQQQTFSSQQQTFASQPQTFMTHQPISTSQHQTINYSSNPQNINRPQPTTFSQPQNFLPHSQLYTSQSQEFSFPPNPRLTDSSQSNPLDQVHSSHHSPPLPNPPSPSLPCPPSPNIPYPPSPSLLLYNDKKTMNQYVSTPTLAKAMPVSGQTFSELPPTFSDFQHPGIDLQHPGIDLQRPQCSRSNSTAGSGVNYTSVNSDQLLRLNCDSFGQILSEGSYATLRRAPVARIPSIRRDAAVSQCTEDLDINDYSDRYSGHIKTSQL